MNERFKFRYWDTVDGNWDHKFNYFQLEPRKESNVIGCTILPLDRSDRYVIQQFTGLLDKNGREIYEGDIVSYSVGSIMDKDDSGHIEKSTIIYHNGYFGLSNYKYDDCQIMPLGFNFGILGKLTKNYECKIIGNIFENPELLKNETGN